MRGWSPFKQEVKPREGTTYVADKTAVIKDPVRNTKQFSNKPMYEGQKPSTHLMAWNEGEGGKFYAFPTLFQTDGVWHQGGKESMSIAREKGELHEFDTKEEAEAFAAGSWKDKHFNK